MYGLLVVRIRSSTNKVSDPIGSVVFILKRFPSRKNWGSGLDRLDPDLANLRPDPKIGFWTSSGIRLFSHFLLNPITYVTRIREGTPNDLIDVVLLK